MRGFEDIFNSKSAQEIHDLSRDRSEESWALLLDGICKYFKNSDIFTEDEMVNHIMIEAFEKGNVFAYETLAEWYKDGIYVEQSDSQYLEILNRIIALPIANEVIWTCKDAFDKGISGYGLLDINILILSSVIGDALVKLGTYYANSSNDGDLLFAEDILRHATWCGFFDELKTVKKIVAKRENLKYKNQVQMSDKIYELREGLYDSSLQNVDNILKGSFDIVKDKVKESFNEENWSKLSQQTKTYILTSLYCYSQLTAIGVQNYEFVDFASVISLLMRGLEYELSLRFFKYYISYLRRHYPNISDYADAVGIKMNAIVQQKKCIIKKTGSNQYDYRLENESDLFTMGSLSRAIGYKMDNEHNQIIIDAPALNYCKSELLKKSNSSDNEVKQWLKYLCDNVEELRYTRNKSSHGGTILNVHDAEEALERLLFVQKLIEYIAEGCNI